MTMRRTRRAVVLLAATALFAGGLSALVATGHNPADASTTPGVVRTDKGLVRGVVSDGSALYQGIPYAAPPTGVRRWTLPRPAAAWSGVRDGSKPGHPCTQLDADTGTTLLKGSSEDCLYLNVVAPTKPARPRPVMVWIHGGGFTGGTSTDYDGKSLAQNGDVVVVTINYRLGVIGMFGSPDLPDSGTYGLADQQAALRWVQHNARAFGGDPGNVTIFGQSAGGMSVCFQLTSPGSAGLFQKAIIESGACDMKFPQDLNYPGNDEGYGFRRSRQEIAAQGVLAAKQLGCPDLACLRKVDPLKLWKLPHSFHEAGYRTKLLPLDPVQALRVGAFHRVPVMFGNTHDEQGFFNWLYELDGPVDAAKYRQLLTTSFGDQAAAVEKEYPASAYKSPLQAWTAVGTDRGWFCPTLRDASRLIRRTPVYTFSFDDRTAPPFPIFPPGYSGGAAHGSEINYVFDAPGDGLNPAQLRLSRTIQSYWTNFARTGNPNGPGLPTWRPYAAQHTTQSLRLGTPGPINAAAEHKCGFWS